MAAYSIYRFNLKSEEQVAAPQPNTLTLGLASTDDVSTFAENVENIFSANVATITEVISQDYTLPYPAGTGLTLRMVFRDAVGRVQTQYLNNANSDVDLQTFASALISAGWLLYPYGTAATSVQISVFQPGQFVE